ncbi:MAG: MFS transporter [Candidatus Dormibacteria bacterium]
MIPTLVPAEMMQDAVAIDSTSVTLARVIGPALAAAILTTAGPAICFLANGLSYVPVVLVLSTLRLKAQPRGPRSASSRLSGLLEGFRFARWNNAVGQALLILSVYVVFTMNAPTLLPSFADRVLHAGARGLGLLIAAQGVGALAGTIIKGPRRFKEVGGRELLAPALVASASLVLFSVTRWIWPALFLMAITGLAQSRLIVGVQRMLQKEAPDHLRGRVMALFSQVMMGGVALGALLAGALARATSAPAAVAIEASAAAIVMAALASHRPRTQLRWLVWRATRGPLRPEPPT